MSLADTSKAIGAVTRALTERIDDISKIPVTAGRPDQSTGNNPHLNLFLYEISFDPHHKNTPLNEGERAPLWLVLKYVLTAFQSATDSDSADAHELLGTALRTVYEEDLLKLSELNAANLAALDSNPSELHVTFDEAPADLLAKLMQGTDEKLRLSIAFQVRPVLIASAAPGDYSLLVGVDYTAPPVALSAEPVGLDVIATMGASISKLSPTGFELDEEVSIIGTDLHLSDLSVLLGNAELPVTMQRPDELRFKVDPGIILSARLSAGSHPVTVAQNLPGTGKKRKSNTVIGNLVPTVTTVVTSAPIIDSVGPPVEYHYDIVINGFRLGEHADDTIVAFYQDGSVVQMFDVLEPTTVVLPPEQLTRQMTLRSDAGVLPGTYNVIVLVNGQQAPQSPEIILAGP